jgi:hypothetical protein
MLTLLAQAPHPLTGYDICQALQKNGRIVVDPLLVRSAIVRLGATKQIHVVQGGVRVGFYGRSYALNVA